VSSAIQTTSVLISPTGVNAVWKALVNEGFTDEQLSSNREILAWVARENGIADFRTLRESSIEIPRLKSSHALISHVRENHDLYADAFDVVEKDTRAWLKRHGVERSQTPAGLDPPRTPQSTTTPEPSQPPVVATEPEVEQPVVVVTPEVETPIVTTEPEVETPAVIPEPEVEAPQPSLDPARLRQLEQAEAQMAALHNRFEMGGRRNRPNDTEIERVINAVAPLQTDDVPSKFRSRAAFVESRGYGLIAEHLRSLLGKEEPGQKAFFALQRAIAADPDNTDAWLSYSVAIATMQQQGRFRGRVQNGFGFTFKQELPRLLRELDSRADQAELQVVLYVLLEATREDDRVANEWQRDPSYDLRAMQAEHAQMKHDVAARITQLRQTSPDAIARALNATAELRDDIGVDIG